MACDDCKKYLNALKVKERELIESIQDKNELVSELTGLRAENTRLKKEKIYTINLSLDEDIKKWLLKTRR
jgi:cell shape-determining protein MreC